MRYVLIFEIVLNKKGDFLILGGILNLDVGFCCEITHKVKLLKLNFELRGLHEVNLKVMTSTGQVIKHVSTSNELQSNISGGFIIL